MPKSFKDYKKELRKKDPEFYNEIMTEAEQEIEEIKKKDAINNQNKGE